MDTTGVVVRSSLVSRDVELTRPEAEALVRTVQVVEPSSLSESLRRHTNLDDEAVGFVDHMVGKWIARGEPFEPSLMSALYLYFDTCMYPDIVWKLSKAPTL